MPQASAASRSLAARPYLLASVGPEHGLRGFRALGCCVHAPGTRLAGISIGHAVPP